MWHGKLRVSTYILIGFVSKCLNLIMNINAKVAKDTQKLKNDWLKTYDFLQVVKRHSKLKNDWRKTFDVLQLSFFSIWILFCFVIFKKLMWNNATISSFLN